MTRYAIVDDTDPKIIYSGDWTVHTAPLNIATPKYNHTVHATNDPTASFTISFDGGSVINAFGSLDHPLTKGVPESVWTLDNNDTIRIAGSDVENAASINNTLSHIELFKSGKFAVGSHNLTVSVTGVSSDGPTFYFDFFAILTAENIEVENVLLDNEDSQWQYDGWTNGNSSSAYLLDISIPPVNGGVATLGFHGTEITVYGNLNLSAPLNTTLAVYQIDDGPRHTILAANVTLPTATTTGTETGATTTPTITFYQNMQILKTAGLADFGQNEHSITISAPANTAPPWAIDYVVYGPSHPIVQSSTATATPTFAPVTHKTSSGAIAGGVVGGLVGIFGIVFAIWFFRRRQIQREANLLPHEYRNSVAAALTATSSRKKKRSSMFMGSRSDGERQMVTTDAPVLGISVNSPMQAPHGVAGSSDVTTGLSNAHTAYHYVDTQPIREQDGGIRLASGDSDEDETPPILPPQYARYYCCCHSSWRRRPNTRRLC